MRSIRWAVVVAFVCGCWSKPRPAPPRLDADISIQIEQVQLANGIRVVVVTEPAIPQVSVTVRYSVGSASDPAGKEGLAHLVEHLMFEHVRGDEALFDFLERRALSFNGYTTTDATIFTERGALSQLDELLEIEAQRLRSSCASIPASAFARQREIVRHEHNQRAADLRLESVLEEAFFASNRKPPTAESVATITQAEACAFVAAHYTTTNAVVVISGAIRAADIRDQLATTLGGVTRTEAVREKAPSAVMRAQGLTMEAPVDRAWFVLAWPMPADFAARTRLRAVTSMAATLVNTYVNGVVTSLEVGSGHSRMIAIAIAPSKDIEASDALDNAKDAIARIGPWFGSGLYEHVKNRALYRFASSLDHSFDRDATLAYEAASVRDVHTVVDDAKRGLVAMSRGDAEDLVRSALVPSRAIVVTLRPLVRPTDMKTQPSSSFHEERRRKAEDPAEAHRPIESVMPANAFARVARRTLGNGMRVVLLPLSTMPTVEVRLVLPVGTADEPVGQRGVALVAAHALEAPFDSTMFNMLQAGGVIEKDVSFDQTVFSSRGLARNVDAMLAGLFTTVREGGYDNEGIRDAANWLTMTNASTPLERVASSAWREALYGANHPYRFASLWHHVDRLAFDGQTLQTFQSRHYRPDGATLVIAGNFDPDNVDRWIDYHFSEWAGAPSERRSPKVTLRALTFAQHVSSPQITIRLAFALPGVDRVGEEVVTQMVSDAIADVREELAASYGLQATLVRRRLGTFVEVGGLIDAGRAGDVLELLAERMGQLRAASDVVATRFVAARRRVLARLSTVDTRAEALADAFVDELDAGVEPRLDQRDVERTRNLTFADVAKLLERVDLANAAILMRGPAEQVTAAYAALGRSAVVLR